MGVFVGGPGVGFDGAEEGDGLARLEGVEMSAGFAGGVFFDQELDVAGVVCVVSFFFFFRSGLVGVNIPKSLIGV